MSDRKHDGREMIEDGGKNKRTGMDSAVNLPYKLDGNLVLSSCFRCRTFSYPICTGTGEDIPFPVSGPVGKKCPLPEYNFQTNDAVAVKEP